MGRDNSPKERQRQQLERKRGRRADCDRILVVSEGSKTEPLYFDEIRIEMRLPAANIAVSPGDLGTEPIRVVQYARQLFEQGDKLKGIEPRAFEQVYAVFDRDDHHTYFDALKLAARWPITPGLSAFSRSSVGRAGGTMAWHGGAAIVPARCCPPPWLTQKTNRSSSSVSPSV